MGGMGTQKSDLPSLLRRGSKLASSSCERAEMSAMVTMVSRSGQREGVGEQARKAQMFWR
jgi:predicted XRE-type DNA-binding protein